ncbi:MAG: alkaline phosphatase [Synergistaceae bacterium]|jgi:alkaline phosphatase|nr:alkaline phosphatase [Synergistaceae bacterium]
MKTKRVLKEFFVKLTGIFIIAILILAGTDIAAAGPQDAKNVWSGKPAKYVFMFIGDGMGLQQISAAEIYLGAVKNNAKNDNPSIEKLTFSRFEGQGMITTYSANSFITDSAPAATSLATGYKTDNGVIGVDPTKTKKFATIAELAKERGMKVGVISSVSINHATPAAFYAHVPSRNDYYGIGLQLLDSGIDYFGGGGFNQPTGKDKDKKSLYDIAADRGIKVLRTRDAIFAAKKGNDRVFAVNPILDADNAMPYEIDRTDKELSLADFTRKGIELLDNEKGFFMQVEGGKIDWTCHANDAATSIIDTFAFDDAVKEAVEFADKHPDETLIVIVGDHETGGMSIGFAGTEYETFFEKIGGQKESFLEFDKKIAAYRAGEGKKSFDAFFPEIEKSFGLLRLTEAEVKALGEKAKAGDSTAARRLAMNLSSMEFDAIRGAFERSMTEGKVKGDEQVFLLYGGYEPLSVQVTHVLNQKAGIGWTTYAHTGIPVPVFAHGQGAELFDGYYDNTDIAWKTLSVMGLPALEPAAFQSQK